ALDLQDSEVLVPTNESRLKKLVVFTPEDHVDEVRQALGKAGAGHIGAYSHCTFNSPGMGMFMPQGGTDPYIGRTGKLERVDEIKIETIIPEEFESKIVQAMIQAHPYEE